MTEYDEFIKYAKEHNLAVMTTEMYEKAISALEQEPSKLLILKSDILLHKDDEKKWNERIEREKAKGMIILPPYFTPLLVPNDVEVKIEQEPCDDAISREAVIELTFNEPNYTDALNVLTEIRDKVKELPSVQPSRKGHWIKSDIPNEEYVCSKCGGACWYYDYQGAVAKSNFCPNCGADMRGAECLK